MLLLYTMKQTVTCSEVPLHVVCALLAQFIRNLPRGRNVNELSCVYTWICEVTATQSSNSS